MPDDQDAVHIDLAVQRMVAGVCPGTELLEMLEMDDRARVVLAEVEAVQEVCVDGGGDDAMRREQFA
jgi:hypothetical protein